MARRAWLSHLAAVLGYVVVAVAFSWPLLPNIATHLTGDPGGDTGVYVWNQWVFQHGALVEHRNPLTTEQHLLADRRGRSISRSTTTRCSSNLLALPLIGWLGTVAHVQRRLPADGRADRVDDVRAGPARHRGRHGRSLAGRAGLRVGAGAGGPIDRPLQPGGGRAAGGVPVGLHRVERSRAAPRLGARRRRRGVGGVLRRLLRGLLPADWRRSTSPRGCCASSGGRRGSRRRARWMLDLCILLAGGLVVGLALGRGGRLDFFGVPVSVRGLYTPMFLLTRCWSSPASLVYLRPQLSRHWRCPIRASVGAARRRRPRRRGRAVAGALRRLAAA